MSHPALGLSMLALIVIAIMMGFPTAFTMMGLGMLFGFAAFYDPAQTWFHNQIFDLFVQRTFGAMNNETLLSIPLFVFMGYIIERAALVDRMFFSVQLAFRRMPASLAVTTLLVCAFWGIASGIVGAVVVLMGVIAMRPMLKAGYDVRLASGVITAGGTLGILIPPSVMLIVYAAVAGQSIVKLYAAAMLPGFFLTFLYLVYIIGWALINPKVAPKLSPEQFRIDVPGWLQRLERGPRKRIIAGLLIALVRPSRIHASTGSKDAGASYGTLVKNVLAALVPAISTLALFAAVWWYVVVHNAPEVAPPAEAPQQVTAKTQAEAPGKQSPPLAESAGTGLQEPPAESTSSAGTGSGVQEPPPVGGVQEPPSGNAAGGSGVQEPPSGNAAGGSSVQEPPAESAATGLTPLGTGELSGPDSSAKDGPLEQMGGNFVSTAGDEQGKIPENFYAWFWSFAALAAIVLLIYYARMDGEHLEILKMLTASVMPLGVLTFIVLAVILFGITTASESAGVGALGALFLAGMAKYPRRTLWSSAAGLVGGLVLGAMRGDAVTLIVSGSLGALFAGTGVVWAWDLATEKRLLSNIKESTFLTAKTTAMVCWLFVGSALFSAVFALHGGQSVVEHWVLGLDLSPMQFMIVAQAIIFVLGWPLEWTEIIVIFVPIFIPLLAHFNVDPVLFGTMVAVNLQAAFLSPPVAMSAFYLKGVAPAHVTLNQIFAGMMPYMLIVIVCLVIMYVWPGMTMWLPNFLYGSG